MANTNDRITITLKRDLIMVLNSIQSEFLIKGKRISYDRALRILLKRCGCEKYLEAEKNE
ncbi:MAG: hypothetical protein ACTSR3_01310 [Candidatus Helarchaeota archaeon]